MNIDLDIRENFCTKGPRFRGKSLKRRGGKPKIAAKVRTARKYEDPTDNLRFQLVSMGSLQASIGAGVAQLNAMQAENNYQRELARREGAYQRQLAGQQLGACSGSLYGPLGGAVGGILGG